MLIRVTGALSRVFPNVFSPSCCSFGFNCKRLVNQWRVQCILATRQLHIRDGTAHKQGPRNKLCAGSNKLPLDCSVVQVNQGVQSDPVPVVIASAINSQKNQSQINVIWIPINFAFLMHIPKSSRPACALHLASLF